MTVETVRWLNDLLITLAMVLTMGLIHPRRFNKPVTCVLALLWMLVYVEAANIFPALSQIKGIMNIALLALMGLGLFKDKWTKKLLSVALMLMLMFANELLCFFYMPDEIITGQTVTLTVAELMPSSVIYTVSYFLMLSMLVLMMNRYKFNLSSRDVALVVLFPLSQFMLLYGWVGAVRQELPENIYKLGLVFAACVVADIALFIIIRSISQRAQLQAENRLLAEQMDIQKEHHAQLTAQYDNIRGMRQDIAKHLDTMEQMLAEGKSQAAREYLAELNASPYDATLGLCENPVLDAFLHSKIKEAESQGIHVQPLVKLERGIAISNVDLVKAFGNLMDNAIEASRDCPEAVISLKCSSIKGYLVVVISNPVALSVEKKSRIPGLERGVGSRVLEELAKKYEGSMKREEKDGVYTTELMLRIGAVEL